MLIMTSVYRTTVIAAFGIALVTAGLGRADDTVGPLHYEVMAVKRKLFLVDPPPETQLAVGATPVSGQALRTGSRSSAEIIQHEAAARFTISAKTTVRLASNRPGVLLEVDRGRLRAIFDKLVGEDIGERLVVTPSAVLAVRGTEYGVEVAKSGETRVVVFSGEVEVVDLAHSGPAVVVPAGQYSTVRRGHAPGQPMPHGMGRSDWDHGRMPGSMSGRGSGGMMDRGSSGGMTGGSSSGGMMGGSSSGGGSSMGGSGGSGHSRSGGGSKGSG